MKVCEAIARWCADVETPFVAGIPGNGILEIIDSMSTATDVPFVLTRHEQGASMMAYSYAFQSGRPAVVVGSKAPGATNLTIGVMGAYVESLPMLVLTAQASNAHEGFDTVEEIDLSALFEPITKWSVRVDDPGRTVEILNEAYRRTLTDRPGPVHVAIPYDFVQQEAGQYVRPTRPVSPTTLRGSLDGILELMRSARRPIIIAGGGVPHQNADDVLAVARGLSAPVVQSWLRKPVPDRDPYCIGMAGIGGAPAARRGIQDADVALVLGCRFSEQMTEHYAMSFAAGAKLVHVDLDPAVIGRVYPVHLGVQADLRDVLPELRAVVGTAPPAGPSDWLTTLQKEQAGYLQEPWPATGGTTPPRRAGTWWSNCASSSTRTRAWCSTPATTCTGRSSTSRSSTQDSSTTRRRARWASVFRARSGRRSPTPTRSSAPWSATAGSR